MGLYSEATVIDHDGERGTYKSQGVVVQRLIVTPYQQFISLCRAKQRLKVRHRGTGTVLLANSSECRPCLPPMPAMPPPRLPLA